MSKSIEILRAERIFEEISNGDTPVYDKANFSDIENQLEQGLDRHDDDYEIETYMNKCFLNSGYKWFELKNGEMQLIKLWKRNLEEWDGAEEDCYKCYEIVTETPMENSKSIPTEWDEGEVVGAEEHFLCTECWEKENQIFMCKDSMKGQANDS